MFLLRKIISAFLLPLPLCFFLLFLAFFFLRRKSYKKSKIFLLLGFFTLVFFSNQITGNLLLFPLENSHPSLLGSPKAKYIIVLGNLHISNDKEPISSQVKETAVNRLVEGLRHYHQLKNSFFSPKLILSGASFGDKNSHAEMQKRLAQALGIPKEDIITVDNPKDTEEEAREIKKIIGKEKAILVTSASHMKRAKIIFDKEGLNVTASPTQHKVYWNSYPSSYFSANNLEKSQLALHEYLGLAWLALKGKL